MNDKKAIEVLKGLLARELLNAEEKEAIREAIGILSWSSLAESRIKSLREKRERKE